jgi:hypothetical protein
MFFKGEVLPHLRQEPLMEGLTRMVSESMARHGVDTGIDHRRLQWSRWFACESIFDLLPVPSRPGLFALAEQILAAGEAVGGKRMLAVLQLSHTEDLAIAMSRLFAPDNDFRERIARGRIFARFTIVEDDTQRHVAHAAFQRWLTTSAEAASGVANDSCEVPATSQDDDPELYPVNLDPPATLPSGF